MMIFLFIFCKFLVVSCLTCSDVLEIPADKKISMDDLQTLPPKETVQCLSHLGKERLVKEEADFVWYSIIQFYGSIAEVPNKILMQLHWITPALKPEDYMNITLSDVDIIQNFGLNYGLREDQLVAIADRVRSDFAGKEPEDYTYYDLTALRQILCAFNQSEIERIHPSSYKEAAFVIGKLDNCKPEVMTGFANLALQPSAFGPPSSWSPSTIEVLGKVGNFLPKQIITKYNIPTR